MIRKLIALIMGVLLLFGVMPLTAYAADINTAYNLPTSVVDAGIGVNKSYMSYNALTIKSSPEYAIAHGQTYKGTKYNTKTDKNTGIRVVDNCYCAAIGNYFKTGKYKGCGVGSKFKVTTKEGKQFTIIWTDTKANKDTDSLNIYHNSDKSVVEFVVDMSSVPKSVKTSGSFNSLEQFKGQVVNIEPLSSDAVGFTDGSVNTNDLDFSTNTDFVVSYNPASDVYAKLLAVDVPDDESSAAVLHNDKSIKTINDLSMNATGKTTKLQTSADLKAAKAALETEIQEKAVELANDYAAYGDENNGVTTGYMSSPLAARLNAGTGMWYANHTNSSGSHWHGGTDFPCPEGTKVLAADGGVVSIVGNKGNTSYGLYVVINCRGYSMWYAHLSAASVTVGQTVKKGDVIALSGNTGGSTGPHLHFEVRNPEGSHNIVLNPIQYLNKNINYIESPTLVYGS